MVIKTSLPEEITPDIRNGIRLAGDNLNNSELEKWYFEEKEAYFEENSDEYEDDRWYEYLRFTNEKLFFSKLKHIDSGNIVFFGPATGTEAENFHLKNQGWKFNFIESSDNFSMILKEKFKNCEVIKPNIDGRIDLSDSSQDVVCGFHVFHHIANISFLFSEISRILKPGGIFILREPCSSMGDWRKERSATPNERGLSKEFILATLKKYGLSKIIDPIPIAFEPINKVFVKLKIIKFIPIPFIYYLDRFISKLLAFNNYYWRDTTIKKFGPSSFSYMFKRL